MKVFPNGFGCWQETHYEIVQRITIEMHRPVPRGVANQRHEQQGHGGLYELAEELTDKFEFLNKDKEGDGDFFDMIDEFCNKELHPKN